MLTKLYNEFFSSEKVGGLILLIVTVLSLITANSAIGADYIEIWNYEIAGYSLVHWINDGLMAIFFLMIGLELEREIYIGELKDVKSAVLPIFGAVGGMLIPAFFFIIFNFGTSTQSGTGIPMATDIAFAIGILSLLGKKVPPSLKVFLVALAVIDDLGAILIIAFFYSKSVSVTYLALSLSVFIIMLVLNRLKVHNLIPYIIGGIIMWYFMHNSGVHATITGVLLAIAIPFDDGGEKSPSYILQHYLHKPVAFLILPVFAIANTCIPLTITWYSSLTHNYTIGIITGLFLGKPLGILIFSFISVKLGFCKLPQDLKWNNIIGVGFLAGIGFTMSIFITLLAFDNSVFINNSKIAILFASLISGITGYFWLKNSLKYEYK
jgi:NhaA family Na+:H+ antiporter